MEAKYHVFCLDKNPPKAEGRAHEFSFQRMSNIFRDIVKFAITRDRQGKVAAGSKPLKIFTCSLHIE
jgi:hypothetical protein